MKKNKNQIMTPEGALYQKIKIIEYVSVGIIILGGIIGAIFASLTIGYGGYLEKSITDTFIIIALVMIVLGFIVFTICFYKMKKMRGM